MDSDQGLTILHVKSHLQVQNKSKPFSCLFFFYNIILMSNDSFFVIIFFNVEISKCEVRTGICRKI